MHNLPRKMHAGKVLGRVGGKMMGEEKKLWGGRFTGETDGGFARFNRSFGFDRRLFEADVRASIAHGEGLREAGVLSEEEAARVVDGLKTLLERAAREGES